MTQGFLIKTPVFEGPLDLLLSLIEKRKLFVGDIALADVADDYIAHVKTLPSVPIGDVAQFLLVASTLVLIKSRSLLPNLALSAEEEQDIHDLETRLKIYARIRELAGPLKEQWGTAVLFPREGQVAREPVFAPAESTIQTVRAAMGRVLAALPKKDILPQALIKKVMSIDEAINDLTKRIANALRMTFKEFSASAKGERRETVVRFLAMLELVKVGLIDVIQERRFEDIAMETKGVTVPKY